MAHEGQGGPGPSDLKAVGDRIESLLEASSSGGAVQRERAEQLVGLVTGLYGAGLERLLDILHELGRLDEGVLRALADDDLVAGLLLVHGLHPYSIEQRVEAALETVRPFLVSQNADVQLLGIDDDPVVRVRLLAGNGGCQSTTASLRQAVENAVEDAAPEVTGVDVENPPAELGLISLESLRVRLGTPQDRGEAEVRR